MIFEAATKSSEGFLKQLLTNYLELCNNLASTKDAMSFWVNNNEIYKNPACIKDLMIVYSTTKKCD